MSTGTAIPAARISRQTSSPLLRGSITSRITRSNGSLVAFFRPQSPSGAESTSYPSLRKRSVSVIRSVCSSSTSRILSFIRFKRRSSQGSDCLLLPLRCNNLCNRQTHGKRTSPVGLAFNGNSSTHRLRNTLGNRQAETAAVYLRVANRSAAQRTGALLEPPACDQERHSSDRSPV